MMLELLIDWLELISYERLPNLAGKTYHNEADYDIYRSFKEDYSVLDTSIIQGFHGRIFWSLGLLWCGRLTVTQEKV